MPFKRPEHFSRWVIFGIGAFLVGFIVAQLLIPSAPGPSYAQRSALGGGQTKADEIFEKKKTDFTPIIIAAVILGAVVAYGYFREKRKNR